MAPKRQQPELAFQSEVIKLCDGRNLWPVVLNPARFNQRVAGNRGFPDLVVVEPGGVLFRELKTIAGMTAGRGLRSDQLTWRDRLKAAGADWDVWTPRDLDNGRINVELAGIEMPDEYSDVWSLVQLGIDIRLSR